jgi:Lrp/AsnC family leucine-responsive transcriptional regulator
MIDEIDQAILRLLQENARMSNAEIARRVEMVPSAVFERVRKLEARGIIRGYEPRLAPKELGYGLVAFVFVRAEQLVGRCQTGELLAAIPEVQEVHHIAGEDCYLVKVRVADTDALGRLLRDAFGALSEVRSTRTTIVLSTLKETSQLPLGPPRTAPGEPAPGGPNGIGSAETSVK